MEVVPTPTPGVVPVRTLLALDEIPELARIPRTTRWRLARSGAFRCYKVGGKYFSTPADIDAWLNAAVVKAVANG